MRLNPVRIGPVKLLIACLAVLIILASIVGIVRIALSQAKGDRYWE